MQCWKDLELAAWETGPNCPLQPLLPRLRLGRDCNRGVHGDARRLPQMVQGCQDKGRPGLQEPHAVPQGLGSAGSVGWIRSRIPTAVPISVAGLSSNIQEAIRESLPKSLPESW